MVRMKQKGWRKEPARHYLAALGVKTNAFFHRPQVLNKSVLAAKDQKLQSALKFAHTLGYDLGDRGVPDNEAELKATEDLQDLCSHVVDGKKKVLGEESKVKSIMWNSFWGGWREGYHEYQEREWWT